MKTMKTFFNPYQSLNEDGIAFYDEAKDVIQALVDKYGEEYTFAEIESVLGRVVNTTCIVETLRFGMNMRAEEKKSKQGQQGAKE